MCPSLPQKQLESILQILLLLLIKNRILQIFFKIPIYMPTWFIISLTQVIERHRHQAAGLDLFVQLKTVTQFGRKRIFAAVLTRHGAPLLLTQNTLYVPLSLPHTVASLTKMGIGWFYIGSYDRIYCGWLHPYAFDLRDSTCSRKQPLSLPRYEHYSRSATCCPSSPDAHPDPTSSPHSWWKTAPK